MRRALAGDEENVGHHHDEAAGGLACLQEHVQLLAQLLAQRVLFLFGHRDSGLRLQCLESCLLQFIPHARSVVAFTFDFCRRPGGILGFTFGIGLGLDGLLRLTLGFRLCLRGLQLLTVSAQTFLECLAPAIVGERLLLHREFLVLTCDGDQAGVLGGLRRLPGRAAITSFLDRRF